MRLLIEAMSGLFAPLFWIVALARHPVEANVDQGASWVGPLLIASGAVVAAVLTILTANWRHSKELQYDRDQRKREHTRDTLDSALTTMTDMFDGLTSATAGYEMLRDLNEEWKKQNPKATEYPSRESLEERIGKSLSDAYAGYFAMQPDNVRLELRLRDPAHEIVLRHSAVRDLVGGWLEMLEDDKIQNGEPNPSLWLDLEAKADAVGTAFLDFRRACRAWYNEDEAFRGGRGWWRSSRSWGQG